jgi:hypothetical protein
VTRPEAGRDDWPFDGPNPTFGGFGAPRAALQCPVHGARRPSRMEIPVLLKRSIIAIAVAALAVVPATGLAQTAAQTAYQSPETLTTPANAPAIPAAAPAAVSPTGPVADAGGPAPAATPPVKVTPVAVTPVAGQVAAENDSTLPVTGFEALLLVAIACVATAAGFALRAASR